jgi:acyl homoserine lactone synthase
MIKLIAPEHYDQFGDALAEMHRLRARVFKGRLDWVGALEGDQEIDRFDALRPHYLLLHAEDRLIGSVRFLPSTGPTMLSETFTELLAGTPAPASPTIWESSRFALDIAEGSGTRRGALALGTYALFAGMIELGLYRGLSQIVTVTDARMERILRRAGWPLVRLGEERTIGVTRTLAGYLSVSREAHASVCALGGLRPPVLWRPALDSAG